MLPSPYSPVGNVVTTFDYSQAERGIFAHIVADLHARSRRDKHVLHTWRGDYGVLGSTHSAAMGHPRYVQARSRSDARALFKRLWPRYYSLAMRLTDMGESQT